MSAAYVFSVAFLAAFLISKYQSQYLLLPCNESLSIHYRSLQGMKRNLVFFSPDIHDGTRCDLALSLYHLNQSIIFASRKCGLPKYSVAHSLQNNDSVTPPPFPSIMYARRSVCSHVSAGQYNEKAAINDYRVLQQYSMSSAIDAIICSFYPAECLNYVETNKTIVFLPAHRFLLNLCNEKTMATALYWMFESHLSHIHVVAMGRYDKEYINYYTGVNVPFIYPSSLLEFSPPEQRIVSYDRILVAPFKGRNALYYRNLNAIATAQGINISFSTIRDMINGSFSLEQLNRIRAVVVFPYAVLSYYLCDLVAAAVPMIVPSRQFLARHSILTDYRNSDHYYCNNRTEPRRHHLSRHAYSPEDNSADSRYYWSQFAYFYTPCSIVFDELEEVPGIVMRMNDSSVYECNLKFIEEMKRHNKKEWLRLIRRINHREMAKSYDSLLRELNRTSVYYWTCFVPRNNINRVHLEQHLTRVVKNELLLLTIADGETAV